MPLPTSFLEHLRQEGYHPRSNKHSNALGIAIVADLVENCPPLANFAQRGLVVYQLNFDLVYSTSTWNVDVVIGRPPPGFPAPEPAAVPRIAAADPSDVQVAIELKAVMTEHRKAAKNRKRDLEAHHEHVHNYNPKAIAAGVMLVNIASRFRSPTRPPGEVTVHRDPIDKADHCITELRNVSLRGGPTGYGLDAKTAIVVNMDNIDASRTTYWEAAPAPKVGDPIQYDAFIQRICSEYGDRFVE